MDIFEKQKFMKKKSSGVGNLYFTGKYETLNQKNQYLYLYGDDRRKASATINDTRFVCIYIEGV